MRGHRKWANVVLYLSCPVCSGGLATLSYIFTFHTKLARERVLRGPMEKFGWSLINLLTDGSISAAVEVGPATPYLAVSYEI